MRINMLKLLAFGLAALGWSRPAQAQNTEWAAKMFEKLEQDFGVVPSGADLKYRLKITNKYQQTVHIASIASECGCTAAKAAKDTLASEESTFIEITMNTRKIVHHKETSLTITFNQPLFAVVRIPVKAFVNPEILVSPGAAEFGSIVKGKDELRKLSVIYNTRGRSITSTTSQNPNIAAKLVEAFRDAAGVHYELQVTIKGTAPLGELRDQVVLATNDPANPTIPVLVEARVEGEFSVTPEFVSFATLAPGDRRTMNIVVRNNNKKTFLIDKIESEKTAGTFEIRLSKEAKTTHILPLTMIAPTEPGTLTEEFTITIKGSTEPITFKAYGKIVPRAGTPAPAPAGVPAGTPVPANP
jgi:hypothetical protein